MIVNCIVCGKEINAIKSTKKYCSRFCQDKALNERRKNNTLNLPKYCIICGTEFEIKNKAANKRQYCYNCLPEGQIATRSYYINLIKQKYGGKCKLCGYNKCVTALEFHHLDINEKEGIVSNSYGTVEKSLIEAEKCILVCSNCHREIHAGLITISEKEVVL